MLLDYYQTASTNAKDTLEGTRMVNRDAIQCFRVVLNLTQYIVFQTIYYSKRRKPEKVWPENQVADFFFKHSK